MGNALRRDDGFGLAAARRLVAEGVPEGVTVLEAGSAGVLVVHELMRGYDALIIIDAATRGGVPGTLYEFDPVGAAEAGGAAEGAEVVGAPDSLHTVDPSHVLALARAAGCLPPRVAIVGCEPADCDELSDELTPAVAAAVPRALALVRARLRAWPRLSESTAGWHPSCSDR